MLVLKIVDRDVASKIDTTYIAEELANVQNVGIIFICTSEGGEEDDWIDEDGIRQIVIHLPYKVIKNLADARPLMLERAKERLGLTLKSPLN